MKIKLVMNYKKYILLIICIFIILFIYRFYDINKENKNTINLSYDEYNNYAPIIDAKEKGLYESEGINLNLFSINNVYMSSNSLIKNDLNAMACSINKYSLLYDKFKKNNIQVVMPCIISCSSGNNGIVSKSNIKSIEDLEGKKIGVPRFSEEQTMLKWFINKSDLTNKQKKNIKYIYFNSSNEAAMGFFSNQLDAVVTRQPYLYQTKFIEDSKILIDTRNANNLIINGIVFKKDFVDKNPELVKKFIKITLKYINEYNVSLSKNDLTISKNSISNNKFFNYNDNIKLLSNEALILFKDMSNIWIEIGEKAYPNESNTAFDNNIILQLKNEFKNQNKENIQSNKPSLNQSYNSLLNKQITIEFKPDSSEFLNEKDAINSLNNIIEIAKIFNGSIIRIEGNSANINNDKISSNYDIYLTKNRAEMVASYLSLKGIDKQRFIIIGNGIDKQIADNNDENGRKKNRRTDISFLISK